VVIVVILAGLPEFAAWTAESGGGSAAVAAGQAPRPACDSVPAPLQLHLGHSLPLHEALPQERPVGPQLDLTSWKPIFSTGAAACRADQLIPRRWRRPAPAQQLRPRRSVQVLFCTWVV
jgi:hypothetical protein